jgi:pimeloyl-ACP methyl ester carboxylesterase
MKTLMLLPGLMCDADVWAPQAWALSRQAHCIVPEWGLKDSLTAMAEQVLAEAPEGRFALAGHSMGGRVALEVVRLAPERVERLALLDTGYLPIAQGEAGAQERAGRMALLERARAEGMRAMGRQWARGMVHPDRLDTPLFDRILAMIERSSLAQFAAQINALLHRPDASDLLRQVGCPALVLCGRQDTWSTVAQHEAIVARIRPATPDARLTVVEDCGHMCTLEQPDAVSAALGDWLGQA